MAARARSSESSPKRITKAHKKSPRAAKAKAKAKAPAVKAEPARAAAGVRPTAKHARSKRSAGDALTRYQEMRDFSATAEPRGEVKKAADSPLAYFIQRHDATRLHYDFRLELDGVLKSWAVPKGPSMVPGDKRLAVEVEDHPFDYGEFEGGIPDGHYGAGHVLLWDRGTWTPEGDPRAALEKGHLVFTVEGEKLHGAFHLIRTGRQQGRKNQWLLIKRKDEHAADEGDVTEGLPVPPLDEITPQLATLDTALPDGDEWVFEPKLDGYRALARLDHGEVELMSRNGTRWTETYGEIAEAVAALKIHSAILDGEICALDEAGRPSFQRMQNSAGTQRLVYFIFDLLFVDGFDVRDRPLHTRKAMLESILAGVKEPLAYVRHVPAEEGAELLALACRGKMEGVIAKTKDGVHTPKRTREWLKIKCQQRQEMVIVGYSAPRGSRTGIGALLLGVHVDGELRYAGKVGTGFDEKTLGMLKKKLSAMEVEKTPAAGAPRMRDATWVRPELVCEVTFTEWTEEGALRHPVFQGLREDKPASAVVREDERDEAVPGKKKRKAPGAARERARTAKASGKKTAPKARAAKKVVKAEADEAPAPTTPSRRKRAASSVATATKTGDAIVNGVRISHPDRIVDTESGLTKLGLAEYIAAVAPLMMPHVHQRPIALVRCPDGDRASCFFQKQRMPGMPETIGVAQVQDQEVLYVEEATGLVALTQFGTMEFHGWGSRLPRGEEPDWIVMDLDPDPTVTFDVVVEAALTLQKLLGRMKLETFVKTTGGKGLHVVAPLVPHDDFDHVKAMTHAIAELMVESEPALFTSVMAKKARTGKIFVDYLRNGFGATAIMPYSARARPGATVACPIHWKDIKAVDPRELTVETVPRLLAKRRHDPWAEMWSLKQRLPPVGGRG